MAVEPSKSDINAIFKRLRSSPANKQCFDCGAMNPTWASVTYGVFLCIDCSAVHRSLGVHLTFIRSTNLDTSWTWLQLRAMQVGGNAAATSFFNQHGCTTNDAQQKYNSRAAKMYREKLHAAAAKAMKIHGTKVIIDSHTEPNSPTPGEKEVDFFKEHETLVSQGDTSSNLSQSQPIPVTNGNGNGMLNKTTQPEDSGIGPSVEAALSTSPTQALAQAEPRKATIGARKPAGPKKGGLGAKKGGLGAQKVKANFSEIETQAAMRDKEREEMEANLVKQESLTKEEEEKKMASMRLAYQDMSIERKKQEEKWKASDPKKAEQMDRLGMGFGGARGVSHSVMSDMKTIDQETPNQNSDRSADRFNSRRLDDFDDFEFVNSFSGPPKYDSPFGLKKEDRYSSAWGNSSSSKNNSWDTSDRFDSKSSTVEDIPKMADDSEKGRSRKNYDVSDSTDAQKKFGNAKAISSDQFFGNRDPDIEMKQNLSKFEGSSSISSADLFGHGPQQRNQDYGGAGPDLSEIKEGVRQGVTKVAGKLSSLANGVINSIQDHYG